MECGSTVLSHSGLAHCQTTVDVCMCLLINNSLFSLRQASLRIAPTRAWHSRSVALPIGCKGKWYIRSTTVKEDWGSIMCRRPVVFEQLNVPHWKLFWLKTTNLNWFSSKVIFRTTSGSNWAHPLEMSVNCF